MIWANRRGARSEIADGPATILGLNCSVCELGGRRNASRKAGRRARNIKSHPMEDIADFFVDCDVRIMRDQNEADRIRRNVGPLQFGGNEIGDRLREFPKIGRASCRERV